MLTRPMMRWASRDKAGGEPNIMNCTNALRWVSSGCNRAGAGRPEVISLRCARLPESFDIVGVANTSLESSQAAAAAMSLPKAYAECAEMVSAPEIDIVTVTVKVAHHLEIVRAAIEAGKHVYCEWPLGNGLAEAEETRRDRPGQGQLGVIGTQARVAPEIEYLKQLIADGFVGEVLSTTLIARGGGWGGVIPQQKDNAYLLDKAGGATMLTIPVGTYARCAYRCAGQVLRCVLGARH